MNRQFYKGHYCLAFYDMEDNYVMSFDNIREIIQYKNLEQNPDNYRTIKFLLYKAFKYNEHITYLLGKRLKVYMIDLNENEDDIKEENKDV